jgi:hypothetical protein
LLVFLPSLALSAYFLFMKLDHFVIHIDNDETILSDLKRKIEPLGFPFEPKWGKGTAGFKAANIWIGRQYFEIVRLLKPDGGGWTKHWVERHNLGKRGIYCVFFATDNIDEVSEQLKSNGVKIQGPDRISFKTLFGLLKKTLPWKLIYTPQIPGTDIEIGFIQYDPDPKDRIKKYLVPNADENGIEGIDSASISLPLTDESISYLRKIFPHGNVSPDRYEVQMTNGTLTFLNSSTTTLSLKAKNTNPKYLGKRFDFQNVSVTL